MRASCFVLLRPVQRLPWFSSYEVIQLDSVVASPQDHVQALSSADARVAYTDREFPHGAVKAKWLLKMMERFGMDWSAGEPADEGDGLDERADSWGAAAGGHGAGSKRTLLKQLRAVESNEVFVEEFDRDPWAAMEKEVRFTKLLFTGDLRLESLLFWYVGFVDDANRLVGAPLSVRPIVDTCRRYRLCRLLRITTWTNAPPGVFSSPTMRAAVSGLVEKFRPSLTHPRDPFGVPNSALSKAMRMYRRLLPHLKALIGDFILDPSVWNLALMTDLPFHSFPPHRAREIVDQIVHEPTLVAPKWPFDRETATLRPRMSGNVSNSTEQFASLGELYETVLARVLLYGDTAFPINSAFLKGVDPRQLDGAGQYVAVDGDWVTLTQEVTAPENCIIECIRQLQSAGCGARMRNEGTEAGLTELLCLNRFLLVDAIDADVERVLMAIYEWSRDSRHGDPQFIVPSTQHAQLLTRVVAEPALRLAGNAYQGVIDFFAKHQPRETRTLVLGYAHGFGLREVAQILHYATKHSFAYVAMVGDRLSLPVPSSVGYGCPFRDLFASGGVKCTSATADQELPSVVSRARFHQFCETFVHRSQGVVPSDFVCDKVIWVSESNWQNEFQACFESAASACVFSDIPTSRQLLPTLMTWMFSLGEDGWKSQVFRQGELLIDRTTGELFEVHSFQHPGRAWQCQEAFLFQAKGTHRSLPTIRVCDGNRQTAHLLSNCAHAQAASLSDVLTPQFDCVLFVITDLTTVFEFRSVLLRTRRRLLLLDRRTTSAGLQIGRARHRWSRFADRVCEAFQSHHVQLTGTDELPGSIVGNSDVDGESIELLAPMDDWYATQENENAFFDPSSESSLSD